MKIKKLIWKNREPGYLDGYIEEMDSPLFSIMISDKIFALFPYLQNGYKLLNDKKDYMSFGSLIEAQKAARNLLKKYILRFLYEKKTEFSPDILNRYMEIEK